MAQFPTPRFNPGDHVGPYVLEAMLGSGGMGEVFRARDGRLGRTVAIKLIRPEFAGEEEFRHRFDREAKSISTLNHPHVCALYDLGEHEGCAYLVMEHIEGDTLTDVMHRTKLSIEDVIRYGTQIADALAAAHARGIIHRDLKAGNIMVTPFGVKVLDFGLAKHMATADAAAVTVTVSAGETQPGQVIGTPAYMSPEQIAGKPLDPQSDVFSAGVVVYEMLCGRRPFDGVTRLDTFAAVLRASAEPPHKLRADTPRQLEQVVLRCLEKDPSARFASGDELRQALSTCSSKAKTFAVPRLVAAAAALIVLASGAFFGWRYYQATARAKWVEETAVPEIARLIQEDKGLAALKLFRQAEQYAPDSRSLFRVAEGVAARPFTFESTPSGASVYISDYTAGAGDDLSQWESLGQSPVKVEQIPNWGYYRVKAVKDGYAPTDAIFGGGDLVALTLQPNEAVPSGMVWVPPMNPVPAPAITLPGFWISRHEVTNAEFKRFVDAGGYQKPDYWKEPIVKGGRTLSWQEAVVEFRDRTGRPGPSTWELGAYPEGAAGLPVGGISWYEAAAYAEFAGTSLPTTWEWNRTAAIAFNSNVVQLSNFSGKGPVAVGTRRGMSQFGTYDMAGNVKEWAFNAVGDQRYILGGAWDESPYSFALPDARSPLSRELTFGFRTVKRITPPPESSFAPVPRNEPISRGEPVGDETYRVFLELHKYEPLPLEIKLENTDERSPYWRRETVSFRAAYGNERVLAHVFLPRHTSPPYQMVLVIGGSTITDTLRRVEDFDYPFEFIVRSGRVVVIPALSGTLERGPSRFVLPASQERERALRWSKDVGRTLEYLETRNDIDIGKLGLYGVSAGASHGVRLLAVHRAFSAAVFSSGGMLRFQPPETDSWNFAPRVRTPILMVNGRYDFILPLETNQEPLFRALGTKEPDKRHVLYDGGHRNLVTRPDLIGEVLDWFDRYLGPVQTQR